MTERTISVFGSGEFEPWSVGPDRAALDRAAHGGAGNGSALIIPTASAPEGDAVFEDWAGKGLAHYESMKVPARVCTLKTRSDAHDNDCIAEIEDASLLYLSGGNPAYLADTLRDTPFWAAVVDAVSRGVALAGCSAGACALGEVAPDSGVSDLSAEEWSVSGLGYLPGVTFGPHWDMLETWIPGAQAFIVENTPPEMQLVALDENTAALGNGTDFTVYGLGQVTVRRNGSEHGPFRAGDSFSL